MRIWLSSKLGRGFWFPAFVVALTFVYQRASVGYCFKRWLRTNEKSPPGASELYQVFWLALTLVWLASINGRVSLLADAWLRYAGAAVAGYRIVEVLLFAFHW